MASLTGNLVSETYKALLKTIDNDILTASEKQITDGFGGGSNVFIDSNGFLRANKYKVTNGLATQFLKADGSLDANTYLTSITSSQIIAALGFTPVTNARTLTINGTTYDLSANRSWTVAGTAAIWGNITGTLSNQTDLQNALNAKFNNPAGTISQYIRGDGSLATFPTLPGGLPIGGTAGQILAKINSTDYNTHWIDNFATQTKNEVKLGGTLAKGAAVYVSSANGTNIIVSAASNTTEALSSKTFGLLETGGVLNDFVKCVTFGLLAGLDTSTATAGDPVWLGVNGALIFGLANKPYAPAHLVYIGVVTRVQSNNGEIFVNVQNGFELKEIHDVSAQSPTNNDGLFYESATSLWKNKSIATVLGYTPQAQLSGTGFIKASGTTISYDNSTYLTTADAATTYQTLANLSTDLTASATKYPSVNAVVTGLGTKQPLDADLTAIAALVGTTGFLIKTAADTWSLDTNTYLTTASAASTYLTQTTAASTYQRLDKMVSNLLASSTEYPNSNAVLAKLALKADAANPVFTGDLSISGATPRLYFVDTDQNPDYTVFIDSGFFYIYDQTAGATRFSINSSGNISTGVGKSITAGSFVKDGGTASQYLMADGSVSTLSGLVTGSGTTNYIPKWTSGSGLGNSQITDDGTYITLNAGNTSRKTRIWNDVFLYNTVYFTDSAYTVNAMIYSLSNNLQFLTNNNVLAMTITSGQNVLIGTSTDSGNKFEVRTSTYNRIASYFSGSYISGLKFSDLYGGIQYDAGNDRLTLVANYPSAAGAEITFDVFDGEKMRLNGYGSLGVGTTNPAGRVMAMYTTYSSGQTPLYVGNTGYTAWNRQSYDTFVLQQDDVTSFRMVEKNGEANTSDQVMSFCVGDGYARISSTAVPLQFFVNGSPSGLAYQGLSGTLALSIATSGVASFQNNVNIQSASELRFYRADNAIYTRMYDAGSLAANGFTFDNMNAEGFHFKNNGTTIMRMPSSNNVLIGTTTDNGYKLTVSGSGYFTGAVWVGGYNGVDQAINFNWSGSGWASLYGGVRPYVYLKPDVTGNTAADGIQFTLQGASGSATPAFRIQAGAYGTSYNSVFGARAGAQGVIQLGNNGDNYIVAGNTATGGALYFYVNATTDFISGTNGTRALIIGSGGAATFDYSVTATSFFESSDLRLKTLIESNPIINGIEKLEAKLYEKNGKIELGYFAQDAELIMPYAVTKNDDGFLNLSYREVHTAKIARLEQRVAELEKQLNVA